MKQTLKGMDSTEIIVLVILAIAVTATLLFISKNAVMDAFTQALEIDIN